MLLELAVRNLGVIDDLSIVLGPGMTALTGETGAGKTLLVEAIELLVGGRADAVMVGPHGEEAVVEGRFLVGDVERAIRRVVPRDGRSRAYVDASLATAAALAELGTDVVDLHGQHAHQSLLRTAAQRAALDRFGSIDLVPLREAKASLDELDRRLRELGGDERTRAREVDLLRFQVEELDAAAVEVGEDVALEREEAILGDAVAHREACEAATVALEADGGADDQVSAALAAVTGRAPLADHEARLRGIAAEVREIVADLRSTGEDIEEDPARLEEVRARLHLLHDLRRKYGRGLVEVVAFANQTRERLAALEDHDRTAAELETERDTLRSTVAALEVEVGTKRRAAAPGLAAATAANLVELAMPSAEIQVDVGPDPGDAVSFLLASNRGSPPLPLTKIASGGELARAMLALRLVLTDAPDTLVFDEVDAGIGGSAAVAVGRALGQLGARHQVLVVTHLPQVAAFAETQIAVRKHDDHGLTRARAEVLDESGRVVELSRMLSGSPDSRTAREHAEELLEVAATERRSAAAT